MRLDCCIYGSAMAFVLCLEDEITVFNNLCRPKYLRYYEQLKNVMNLQRFTSIFDCVPICGANPAWYSSEDNVTVSSYAENRTSVPSQTFDAAKAWPNGLPGYESRQPLKTIREGSALSKVDRVEIEEKPQFHPICTTFSNLIPTVPYASINNEAVAISNRALMEVNTPKDETWRVVEAYAEQWIRQFNVIANDDLDGDFERWNSKFPYPKQKLQAAAWEDLKKNPLNRNDFRRKLFVKRELTLKKPSLERPEYDPRAIQANEDRLNVAFGPFVGLVSKQLKALWNLESDITYTGGMNAEQIGTWRNQFEERDVTIIELDESRYDAHQGKQSYELFRRVLHRCDNGYGDVQFALKSMEEIQGYSSHGIKYRVKYTMTSGSPTTSDSNSFLNGCKTAACLEALGFKNYKMVIHGDDSLVVIEGVLPEDARKALKAGIEQFNKDLGFETKVKISNQWHDVEYCSSLFWPVENGFVLGPKIGKRLPKIGFSLNKLSLGEIKGMLLGLTIEASFVPVIRTYAKHQLKLLKKTAAVQYVDARKQYKSLPESKHKANMDTEVFFEARYGVTVQEAEDALRKVLTNNLTDCVCYDLLELFATKDL